MWERPTARKKREEVGEDKDKERKVGEIDKERERRRKGEQRGRNIGEIERERVWKGGRDNLGSEG